MSSPSIRSVLIATLLFSLHPIATSAEPTAPEIQGLWFGDSSHTINPSVLIVEDDGFLLITSSEGYLSSTTQKHGAETLNGNFAGSKQDLYSIVGSKLHLKLLTAPNNSRPIEGDLRDRDGLPQLDLVFDRKPTLKGLVALHEHFSRAINVSRTDSPEPTSRLGE